MLLFYLDSVIVISADFTSPLQNLEDVFEQLQDVGLKLKPAKRELLQDKVHYMGYVVSAEGITKNPDKVAAICEWKTPKDIKALQAYRQYISDFATIGKPLPGW